MILRLDPRIPMVWRDPFSLQFGVEPARVVLRDVSARHERLISTLAVGISDSGFAMMAEMIGIPPGEASALLTALEPVLDPPATVDAREGGVPQPPTAAIEIVGSGPTTERIARTLAQSGCRVTVGPAIPTADSAPDFGIAVGHYVFDPAVYSHWLRRDIPHLPVIFADGAVTVGPLVVPGETACLHCIEFYRRDSDERWATLAAQLWGTRSAAETPVVSREATAIASRIALARVRGGQTSLAQTSSPSFRIDAGSGDLTRTEWLPHPRCGCCSISGVLRGIDSALSRRRTAFPPPPRRARAVDARA